jgi:hypothetical protein
MDVKGYSGLVKDLKSNYNIVTYRTISRQRLLNTFPMEPKRGAIGHPLLGNGLVNTLLKNICCFLCGQCKVDIKKCSTT